MPGRQQGGNERHGAPEQSQHVYSWVGDKDDMNSILSSVPAGEKYILLGDFNACVGSR